MLTNNRRFFLGIDVGSLTCDAVLIDQDSNILSSIVMLTGVSGQQSAENAFKYILDQTKLKQSDILMTVSTGYGRERVSFSGKTVTEITCHGKGAHATFPNTRLVIDIGGQDSKAIRINPEGKVLDFVMNDRCAAGTGRFLEVMARALEIELADMGEFSRKATESCPISSICTVFAESEVVSLLAQGKPVDHIIQGIHEAVARRTIGLVQRLKLQDDDIIMLSGGVALNKGVVTSLEKLLDRKILIPPNPQIIGALGAALFAKEKGLN